METTIAAAHKYIDTINIHFTPGEEKEMLQLLTEDIGVPASKIGWLMSLAEDFMGDYDEDRMYRDMVYIVNTIKERGLRGLSLFSVNQENNYYNYRGKFLSQIAETLYSQVWNKNNVVWQIIVNCFLHG